MDEVVTGVMAHEIAHVTQRRYNRSQEAFKGKSLLSLAGWWAPWWRLRRTAMLGRRSCWVRRRPLMDKQRAQRNPGRERTASACSICTPLTIIRKAWRILSDAPRDQRRQLFAGLWLTHPTQRMEQARLKGESTA